MVVILVVPIEEPAAEVPGVINAPEPLRKPRLVFQGFEVALGERVVVGRVRPVVRTGDTKIGQQKRGRLGLHWGATIGVKRELVMGTAWLIVPKIGRYRPSGRLLVSAALRRPLQRRILLLVPPSPQCGSTAKFANGVGSCVIPFTRNPNCWPKCPTRSGRGISPN